MAEEALKELQKTHEELLVEIQQDKLTTAYTIQKLQQRIIDDQKQALDKLNAPQPEPKQKQLPMNSSQPQYNGYKTENIMDWINITTTNLTNAHIPNTDWVSLASSYLRTNALQQFQSIRDTNPNWKQFTDNLISEFLPPNYN